MYAPGGADLRYNSGMDTHHANGAAAPTKATGPIKAVIFDWGGVIEILADAQTVAAWETRLGIAAGSLAEVLWGAVWQRLEVGAITAAEYEAGVCAHCGFAGRAELEAFYESFYPQRVRPEMLAAVRALRGRYQVALLTNAFPGQHTHIARLAGAPPEALFDHYINSADVGLRKPDPAIFRLVLDRLGVQPAEAVFLDDLPSNVAAATTAGLHAILYQDPIQALQALETLLGHAVTSDALPDRPDV